MTQQDLCRLRRDYESCALAPDKCAEPEAQSLAWAAAAGCLLLHYLYRTAIKPVTAIQATVREYIDSKDSGAVAENMDRIT